MEVALGSKEVLTQGADLRDGQGEGPRHLSLNLPKTVTHSEPQHWPGAVPRPPSPNLSSLPPALTAL